MVIRTMIAEDNRWFREQLADEIASFNGIEVAFTAANGEEFLNVFEDIKPELVILDINMPKISGVEVARVIRKRSRDTEIIFITSYEQFMKEAFALYAADYITKPLDKKRLKQTLFRIKRKLNGNDKIIQFNTGETVEIVKQNELYFVEAYNKKTLVYTAAKVITANYSLKDMEEMVDKDLFFKTGRSYLVNLTKIASVRPSTRTSFAIFFKGKDYTAYLSKRLYQEFRIRLKEISG
ncbi:LytTR family DNA-binding domain-containing protein [Metallumcola ferriviriculae]|uniref:Stage 0 sporulation protein A homolog n=1 Tax=Metallumcola ferriviriculae TaxID=3039180 RepID=A0AAU0URE5_9FIRM|nr:LytTR family DNA-binding domain-containing protein [Desulfitibacteraceae bacterium MK1]